jgi:catechol 2,3-dioxygenase-like lactoylglutathione lyase family enzyme
MLSPARVIAFVPSCDLERAKAFYVEKLGLKFVTQDSFALVLDGNGTMVRIAKVGNSSPLTSQFWDSTWLTSSRNWPP